eukprot:TRINITY_DN47449_c0_g1_i1.p1 TRINITY_DN47449_c0_g1~~TRINITY_DN47449_c0_g1_i1.p1  ORF type:complete len:513 (-),score=95.03 TRINITY_DN47449_c0_g1_i1:121-1659(-)
MAAVASDCIHVIIADDEHICRFSAASVFKRLGILSQHLHEVEDLEEAREALFKVQAHTARVIVVLPQRFCKDFAAMETGFCPYIVCASSMSQNTVCGVQSVMPGVKASMKFCNYVIPKTFDEELVLDCLKESASWWGDANGNTLVKQSAADRWVQDSSGKWCRASVAETSTGSSNSSGYKVGEVTPPAAPTPEPTTDRMETRLKSLRPAKRPFDDVHIIAMAGRGSFGCVYKAMWGIAEVALKVTKSAGDAALDPLLFEGALSSSLSHPNLVQTYKYATRELMPGNLEVWIVQEWCNLGTLQQRLRTSQNPLALGGFAQVTEVALEITSAASYLHGRGVVHGDLSANNVLLCLKDCSKGYITKISDFGASRILLNDDAAVKTASLGTVVYMPPECFNVHNDGLSKKVDVYSFGVILWQLCTNQVPFLGFKPPQIVVLLAQGTSLELPSSLPGQLLPVLRDCLAKQADIRPTFEQCFQRLYRDLISMQTCEDLDDIPCMGSEAGEEEASWAMT